MSAWRPPSSQSSELALGRRGYLGFPSRWNARGWLIHEFFFDLRFFVVQGTAKRVRI